MAEEQWKSGGNCSKCRRRPYCKKRCSAAKAALERAVIKGIARHPVGRAILGVCNRYWD